MKESCVIALDATLEGGKATWYASAPTSFEGRRMGTWAYGLYADDDAQDARYAYKQLLSQGLDDKAASDQFLKDWKESLKDSDEGPLIWMVLAETQWKLGRLEDRVRDKAIRIIDDGSSLDRWREGGEKMVARRQKVLDALKEQLLSPQPARKVIKVKRPSKIATWTPGELFSYRLKSGQLVVLCLEDVHEGHHARLSALDWIGDQVPAAAKLKSLKRKRLTLSDKSYGGGPYTHWHVLALKKRDVPYDRMTRLEVKSALAPEKERFGTVQKWGELDESLQAFFGWK
jgi:hypothetical protein